MLIDYIASSVSGHTALSVCKLLRFIILLNLVIWLIFYSIVGIPTRMLNFYFGSKILNPDKLKLKYLKVPVYRIPIGLD